MLKWFLFFSCWKKRKNSIVATFFVPSIWKPPRMVHIGCEQEGNWKFRGKNAWKHRTKQWVWVRWASDSLFDFLSNHRAQLSHISGAKYSTNNHFFRINNQLFVVRLCVIHHPNIAIHWTFAFFLVSTKQRKTKPNQIFFFNSNQRCTWHLYFSLLPFVYIPFPIFLLLLSTAAKRKC